MRLPIFAVIFVVSLAGLQAKEIFPEKRHLFNDALQNTISLNVKNVTSVVTKASTLFQEIINSENRSEDHVDAHKVMFEFEDKKLTCEGAIIKESDRLSVSHIPESHRDRAGLVIVNNCVDSMGNKVFYKVRHYVVLPLDESLPVGNFSLEYSYEIYKEMTRRRPEVACVENDVNSNGDPRTQTQVFTSGDEIIFGTYFSTSVPIPENKPDDYIEDRAMLVDTDADTHSVHEIKESLDFLVHAAKGRMLFSFPKTSCSLYEKEGMQAISCAMAAGEYITLKDQRGVKLSEAYAQFETQKREKLLVGVGSASVISEYKGYVTYTLVFGAGKQRRTYSLKTQYEKSPIGSVNECNVFNP